MVVLLVAAVGGGGRRRPQQVERRQLVRAARPWRRCAPSRAGRDGLAAPPPARARPARPGTPGARPARSSGRRRGRAPRGSSAARGFRPRGSDVSPRVRSPTGSRSERDSRNSLIRSMMRGDGVPVKIRSPSVASPSADDARADRREHARERVGRQRADEPGRAARATSYRPKSRVPAEERDEPEDARARAR